MTKRLFHTSPSLSGKATIITANLQNDKLLIELDQTLFSPKGGGQRSDLGMINGWEVIEISNDRDTLTHALPPEASNTLYVGQLVTLIVNAERREQNCRLHTAGHLIAQVAEQIVEGSTAQQGHHWPDESRVELDADKLENLDEVKNEIEQVVNRLIRENRAVTCTDGIAERRTVKIAGFRPIECGGTHVATLDSLGFVEIRSLKWKNGRLRIGYNCKKGSGP